MPRRALLHEDRVTHHDEIAARCREWRTHQHFSNGGKIPSANQCPCGEPQLSEAEMKQCALPGERPHNAGTPLMSGGQALFLLLILLTVSMCVSVLLSPESRRRRRERVEREAREKARVLRRKEKEWNRSVKSGLWLTQPDGAVCVCVAEKGFGLSLDGDASRSRRRRRRRAAAKLALNSEADNRDNCGGSSTDSSGGGSDAGDSSTETDSETDSDRDDDAAAVSAAADVFVTVPNRVDSASGSGLTSSAAEREEETRPRRLSEEVAPAERLGEANV